MPDAEPKVLWSPTAERAEAATLTRFARWVSLTRGIDVSSSYAGLWQWSVDELEDFWAAIWTFFNVEASTPYKRVLTSRRDKEGRSRTRDASRRRRTRRPGRERRVSP